MTNKEAIFKLEALYSLSSDKELKYIGEALNMAINALEKEDGALVAHGRWEPMTDYPGTYSKCTVCGKKADGYRLNMLYCPNCGAKMDLED